MTETEARRIVLARHPCAYVNRIGPRWEVRAYDHAPPLGSAGRTSVIGVGETESGAWVSAARRMTG